MKASEKLRAQTSTQFEPNKEKVNLGRQPAVSKLELNGLFSSILSAAQNAANIIGKQDNSSESLLLATDVSRKHALSVVTSSKRALGPNLPSVITITPSGDYDATVSPASNTADGIENSARELSPLLASNVHFEPVTHSPLSTLGNGDLQLSHFEKKRFSDKRSGPDARRSTIEFTSSANDTLTRKPTLSSVSRTSRRNTIASTSDEANSDGDKQSLVSETLSFLDSDSPGDIDNAHVATKKKTHEFRHVFKNISEQEKLVAAFSCALLKEILVQGKMYLTQNYLCFNSNILGWVTNLIIPLQEVIQIEKKSTVLLFPNGMAITTLHQKYVFATFHARDAAFDLITNVWKKSLQDDKHAKKAPKIKRKMTSKLVGTRKLVLENSEWSDDEGLFSDPGDDLQLLPLSDETDDEDRYNIMTRSIAKKKSRALKADEEADPNSHDLDFEVDLDAEQSSNESEEFSRSPKRGDSFKGFENPGPSKHSATSFDYQKSSNDVLIIEKTFNAPLGAVVNMLYGPDNSFYIRFLEDLKNFDIEKEKITDLTDKQKTRKYAYVKPLSGPIGPKQTKCNITESLDKCDYSSYCEVQQITQTPDVPLGNSFKVKTLLFFAWGDNNDTKMTVYTSIEWSSKSWLKSAIEKGSIDGQKQSMAALAKCLSDALSSKGNVAPLGSKKKRRLAIVNDQQSSAKDQAKSEPEVPPSLIELLFKLMENIGLRMPFRIPLLDDMLLGGIVLVVTSLVYSLLLVWAVRSKHDIRLSKLDGVNVIKVDGRPYNLMPTTDTYLSDVETKHKIESQMWDWIISRSGESANLSLGHAKQDKPNNGHSEFEEIVSLTRKRLDEVYYKLA